MFCSAHQNIAQRQNNINATKSISTSLEES